MNNTIPNLEWYGHKCHKFFITFFFLFPCLYSPLLQTNFSLLFPFSLSFFSRSHFSLFFLLSRCLFFSHGYSLSSLPCWSLLSLLSHGQSSSKTLPLIKLQKPMAISLAKCRSPQLLTIATYSGGFFLSLSHYGCFSHGSWVIFQIGFMGFGFWLLLYGGGLWYFTMVVGVFV